MKQSKPFPFYYGWVMLGIAIVMYMMTLPGQTAGVALFAPSFEEALDLTRTEQTGAYALGTFLASLAMTYVGAQMDRYGLRRVALVVVVLLSLACVYTGFVSGFWTLFIAFLFLRMFGQGSLSLLAQNTAAMWFDKRLGLAQSIITVGFSVAAAGMPLLVFWLIERFDWRMAYPILGGIVLFSLLPLLLFVFVDRPSDIGQKIDGGAPNAENGTAVAATPSLTMIGFTLQEAMRTPAYWIIAGMMFAVSMIGTAIGFNFIFLFESFGLTEGEIVQVLAILPMTQALAQIVSGWLADIFSLRWLAFVNMIGQLVSLGLLLLVDSIEMAWVFAVFAGLFNALHNGVISPLWARYFGRAHLGKIRGSITTATVAGSSAGPYVMGSLFDLTGSYTPSILIFMGIYAVFVVLVPFAKRPTFPADQSR